MRIKLVFACVLVCGVAVLATMGAASASAAACEVKFLKWLFCTGGNETSGQEFKGPVLPATTTLKATIAGIAVEIGCAETAFDGTLKAEGTMTGTYVLTSCSKVKPAICTLGGGGSFTTETLSGKLEPAVLQPELVLTTATKWLSIELKECALEGTFALTGSQRCKFDAQFEKEQKEHEIICTATGSELKMAGKTATLSVSTGELLGLANWSMKLN